MKSVKTVLMSLALIAAPLAFAAKTNPEREACDYNSWLEKGSRLAKAGECKKAIGAYTRALLCQPTNPWAWFYRSELHDALGETTLGKRDMDRALEFAANGAQFDKRKTETFECNK